MPWWDNQPYLRLPLERMSSLPLPVAWSIHRYLYLLSILQKSRH